LAALRAALSDAFPTVQVAAATALCRQGQLDESLPVLTRALKARQSPVRLQAILALDELGPRAAPALEAIREATRDAKNPYVARVARHALGQLEPDAASQGP
jgi:HEAT repeat protein